MGKYVCLILTIPYVCVPVRGQCGTTTIELYLQNNHKPMCELNSILAGCNTNKDAKSQSGCQVSLNPIKPGENIQQSVNFTIEAAVSSLYTGANYLLTANFKFSSRVTDHPKWANVMSPPVQV